MKKLLALLLVLTMTFSLAACGSKDKTDAPSEDSKSTSDTKDTGDTTKKEDTKKDEEPAQEPKVLNLLEAENIPALITWQATDSVSFEILGNINSGLYTLGIGGTPTPDMAEDVEIAEDGLTYTFKLRKDLKWATIDGEEYGNVTAHDFVFAWKKLLDPKEAAQYAMMMETAAIKNGAEAVALNTTLVTYDQTKKDLSQLSVDNFEATETETAQQQFDKAKVELDEKVATFEADLADKYGSVEDANAKIQELIDNLAVTAVDDHTLKVELANPVPYFIDLMTFASFFPANEKFYNEVGADKYGKTAENFLYNGAYIFKEWKLSERHYLVKNPLYWDAANVDLDAIDYRVIEGYSNETSVQMYLDGEIDRTGLAGERVEQYGNRPDAEPIGETVLFYLEVNINNGKLTQSKKLLRDARVRKAMNMAIDKSYITDVIYKNGSIPVDFFVPKGFVGSAAHDGKGFRQVAEDMFGGGEGYNPYNPEKATELWKEALADQGVDKAVFEMIIYTSEEAAQVGTHLKNELEKNLPGLEVEILPLPFAEKLERTTNGDFAMNWGGWGPDYPDAMTFMDMWVTGGAYNRGRYSDEEYDAGIAATKSGELTAPSKAKERFETLVELEKKLLEEDQVVIPLFQRAKLVLSHPKFKDIYPQSFGADYIWKWVKVAE